MPAEESFDAADPFDPNDIRSATQLVQEQHDLDVAKKQAMLRNRRDCYIRVFTNKPIAGDANIVLADLKRFCRGDKTPWDADPRVHALLTGRFEVYTRIAQHMRMTFDELWEMYGEGIEA